MRITTAIKDTASTNLPLKNYSQPHWMSEETKCAIDGKHKIRKVNGPSSSEYKIAKAESKKLVKKDKLKQIERDINLLSSLPPHKQYYYAALKRLKGVVPPKKK